MARIYNLVMTVLFSLVLLGPTAVFVCEKAGVDLPSWASSEDARWLSGSVDDANVGASASFEGFTSGSFQDAVSTEVGNRVPFKAAAMLGNAAWQRGSIAIANLPFGYECYPTYFRSARVYIPSEDAVGYVARKEPSGQLDALKKLGEGASSFAERHPDVDIVLLVVQSYRDPAVSPTYSLVSDCVTPQDQVLAVQRGTGDAANAHVESVGYGSLEEYYSDYYRTDHHWNYKGCITAYNAIAQDIGLPAFDYSGEIVIQDYRYTGATARFGLDSIFEEVADTAFDFDSLFVTLPDGTVVPYGHEAFLNEGNPGRRYRYYDTYYDNVPSGSVVQGMGEGSAILISNSFGGGILPYIAMHYSNTLKLNSVHKLGRSASDRLERIVEERDADVVYIIADPTDLADFQAACPNYFDAT